MFPGFYCPLFVIIRPAKGEVGGGGSKGCWEMEPGNEATVPGAYEHLLWAPRPVRRALEYTKGRQKEASPSQTS